MIKRNRSGRDLPFTGTCHIREYTGSGHYVGHCYFPTKGGICPRHDDVSEFLSRGENNWPRDFELPKHDGTEWGEKMRKTVYDRLPKDRVPDEYRH